MMKKLTILAACCLLSAVGMKAAPPLRGLVPMQSGSDSLHPQLSTLHLPPSTLHLPPSTFPPQLSPLPCPSSRASSVSGGAYLQHVGSPRVLTILAAFQDVGFTVNDPVKAFDQYLNGEKQEDLGNSNHLNLTSVRQYFETCSHGRFSPRFNVVGPVVLPQTMDYYGGTMENGADDLFRDFCRDALAQAKPLVSDWSQYDNDGDGRVELVCIIFAGYGQNQGGANNTLWAKAGYQGRQVDSRLSISYFNCISELFVPDKGTDASGRPYDYSQYINGTGVFIHEMSHCLGLPDLYATTSRAYVNNQGMESYSVMDYGLYNYNGFAPCPYTAWEQEVMGWTEIEGLTVEGGGLTVDNLLPLIEGGKAYKFVNAGNDRDYIVMENVQKTGLNRYASGHGLLVYHVNYPSNSVNMTDAPNNNPGRPSVAVVPAGGLLISRYARCDGKEHSRQQWAASLAACPFPGTKNVSSLTPQMELPNYCFYDGQKAKSVGYVLTGITENAETGTVSFSVAPDQTVGIAETVKPGTDANGMSVFDLQGRKVHEPSSLYRPPLTKGIYIVNGKKIVVR